MTDLLTCFLGLSAFIAVFVMYDTRSGRGIPKFEPCEGMEEYIKSVFREEFNVALGQRSSMHHVQARIVECGGSHGLRREFYKAAESTFGLYREDGSAFERCNEDLVMDVVFSTRENAHRFMTSLMNLCEWNRVEFKDVVVEVFEGEVSVDGTGHPCMINRTDYKADDTNSPDGTASQSLTAQTFLLATDPLTRFQSVERPSLFRTSKAEACHIIDKKLLPKHLKGVRNENNLVAMTGTMHSMFDGTKAEEDIPTIRISAENASETKSSEAVEGRHEVVLKIEALNDEVAGDVQCFLRDGFKREAKRFFYVSVFVKDVEEFKYNVSFKHERTTRRWKKAGHD